MFEYRFSADMAKELEAPSAGITSRTFFEDERVKIVNFAFAEGESLSEHTASVPAVVHILQGEAKMTFEQEERQMGAGSWVHMDANLPHSVTAVTPMVMVIYLLRGQQS